MEAGAALGGTEGDVMLDPVTVEDAGGTVVTMNGQGDGDGALWHDEPLPEIIGDVEMIRDDAKLLGGHFEGRILVYFHRLRS